MTLAFTASGWTEIIVSLSIFVPVAIATVLTVWILRGKKHDPDEQRWRRQAEERKRLDQEAEHRPNESPQAKSRRQTSVTDPQQTIHRPRQR